MESERLSGETIEDGAERRTPWVLTPEAFDRLLLFLAPDRDVAAAQYELLHGKLIKFFEWRNAFEPERLADETLNRVARKLSEGTEVRNPNPQSFVLGVARMVFLESRRRQERERETARELAALPVTESDPEIERQLRCLDSCLDSMSEARDLLLRYYSDSGAKKIEARRSLAAELAVTAGVLRLRAHRLRMRLESCVSSCAGR